MKIIILEEKITLIRSIITWGKKLCTNVFVIII